MQFTSYKSYVNEKFKEEKNITVLYPGSYKPMHAAHVSLIKRYASHPNVKEVKVLIGPGVRNGITQKEAFQIVEELLSSLNNVTIEAVKYPSPILTIYKFMETADPGIYAMAAVRKGKDDEDYKRVLKFVKDFSPVGKYFHTLPKGVSVIELPVNTKPVLYKGRTDEYEGTPVSASILRQDILNDDYNNFRTNYAGYDEDIIKYIWNTTQMVIEESLNEDEIFNVSKGNLLPDKLIDTFYQRIKVLLNRHNKNHPLVKKELERIEDINGKIPSKIKNLLEESLNEADNSKQITGVVNKHMTHAEDLVFLSGKEGLKWVIDMFKELYEKLKSDTESNKIKLSVKFDGAPSLFVWSKFPGLENPGLAIKGLFAKDRKIMYNDKNIDKFYSDQPDLAIKLKLMLKYIPAIGIPKNEIWQGDFLFDKTTLVSEKNHYSFHPNTIVYKVEKDSDIGKKISQSDIGVVWHTRYTGDSLDNISAKYDTKVSELKENSKVFMADPYIASLAGYVTLLENEKIEFEENIYIIERLAKNLYKSPEYNKLIKDKELIDLFKIFQNSLIRENIKIDDAEEFLNKFIEFIDKRFKKEIFLRKTTKSQDVLRQKQQELIEKIEKSRGMFQTTISLILAVAELKNMFIKKLNNLGKFETYLQINKKKFIPTGQEGFAISDIHGNVVKLVDRYEFSFANFSPKIIKGWIKN